jgi:hypothetical protein
MKSLNCWTRALSSMSYEMGNSIEMVKRLYHIRQPIEATTEWFDSRPKTRTNIVPFDVSMGEPEIVPPALKKCQRKSGIQLSARSIREPLPSKRGLSWVVETGLNPAGPIKLPPLIFQILPLLNAHCAPQSNRRRFALATI